MNPLAEMLEGGAYGITAATLMITEDKKSRPLKGGFR
jgi:hypothetical protein